MDQVTLVALGTKARFRRGVPKSYSYRYEVAASGGPPDAPLVDAGAGIIEGRYRGRTASWRFSESMLSTRTYTVQGRYVAPARENPLTYPPNAVAPPNVTPIVAAVAVAAAPEATPGRAVRRATPAPHAR
jgi:hypothetical protein